jgi:hypothetical protein
MSLRFARWRSACAALFLGLTGASSAVAQAPALKPLDPPQAVRVAYVPIMKFATAYVAEARGLFKKYGLDVKLDSVKSGTEAIAFLDKGSVDVGGISIVASLWSAWNRGLDIRVIAPGALDPMTDGPTKLIVRKDLIDSGAVKTSPISRASASLRPAGRAAAANTSSARRWRAPSSPCATHSCSMSAMPTCRRRWRANRSMRC